MLAWCSKQSFGSCTLPLSYARTFRFDQASADFKYRFRYAAKGGLRTFAAVCTDVRFSVPFNNTSFVNGQKEKLLGTALVPSRGVNISHEPQFCHIDKLWFELESLNNAGCRHAPKGFGYRCRRYM